MDDPVFLVQPYVAKASGLVAQPAQTFADAASARRAGRRLSRYRAGVVVLSQGVDPATGRNSRPETLAVHGRVPDGWVSIGKAA